MCQAAIVSSFNLQAWQSAYAVLCGFPTVHFSYLPIEPILHRGNKD